MRVSTGVSDPRRGGTSLSADGDFSRDARRRRRGSVQNCGTDSESMSTEAERSPDGECTCSRGGSTLADLEA